MTSSYCLAVAIALTRRHPFPQTQHRCRWTAWCWQASFYLDLPVWDFCRCGIVFACMQPWRGLVRYCIALGRLLPSRHDWGDDDAAADLTRLTHSPGVALSVLTQQLQLRRQLTLTYGTVCYSACHCLRCLLQCCIVLRFYSCVNSQ